ncbi:iron chelate uptake ABC transporter family permease subunit [Citrobacter amalonaticus]|nr:iron chelate uptake ABC transporter family permease subunit [Citrobacter amalonaticus]
MKNDTRSLTIVYFLLTISLVGSLLFMTLHVEGQWAFALILRAQKLLCLIIISCSIAVSTVLFQTIMQNRILTPSIMGFDAIFILTQTLLSASLGFMRLNAISSQVRFFTEMAIMLMSSILIYRWLFREGKRDLFYLALSGLALGTLLRGIANFIQRILNPGEFSVLQDKLFSSFNLVDPSLIFISASMITILLVIIWRMRFTLDVILLGRNTAISLGIDYVSQVRKILFIISLLVSTSTALVGPVTFFGLLVSNLAYFIIKDNRHTYIIPASALIAMTCLIIGQTVLERIFGFAISLSIIIEFFGGIMFIFLIIRSSK